MKKNEKIKICKKCNGTGRICTKSNNLIKACSVCGGKGKIRVSDKKGNALAFLY